MNTQNTHQEPGHGAYNTKNTSKLTLDQLATLLRDAGYDAWVNDVDVAIKLDSGMIGLEHLEEHKALSLRTSVAFVCELPDAVKYQMANELNEGAIGIRFYQQSRQLEILSIAVCSEHLYADERNVNAAMLAGLLEHFLAEMHKAVKSVDTMFVNLDKVSDDLEQLFARRS